MYFKVYIPNVSLQKTISHTLKHFSANKNSDTGVDVTGTIAETTAKQDSNMKCWLNKKSHTNLFLGNGYINGS